MPKSPSTIHNSELTAGGISASRPHRLSRRAFLQGSALVLGGLGAAPHLLAAEGGAQSVLRIALLTDVHHADKDTRGSRHYRDSLDKLREAIGVYNAAPPDFAVHLGDLIDSGESVEKELVNLDTVEAVLEELSCPRHYVLGNHCVDGLTKSEYLEHTAMDAAHLAFDHGGLRFVTLDSCYRSDGEAYGRRNFEWTDPNIPEAQLRWLKDELAASGDPVIVFAHQRLDDANQYSVRNAAEVRAALEAAGKVVAVFQGHSHRQDYQEINGIHYCTQVAMIEGPGPESSAYALLHIHADGSLRVEGFRQQEDVQLGV